VRILRAGSGNGNERARVRKLTERKDPALLFVEPLAVQLAFDSHLSWEITSLMWWDYFKGESVGLSKHPRPSRVADTLLKVGIAADTACHMGMSQGTSCSIW